MSFRVLTALAFLAVVCAVPARAQQSVKLEFKDGRVSLKTQNAPLRTILAEWARLGGATIVNGDRIPGAPVTLELVAVPERQALDTLLRSAAAYMLAPRRAGSVGTSAFDRILILPTSSAPRNPPPGPTTPVAGAPRPILPRPPAVQAPNVPGVAVADDPDDDAPGPPRLPGDLVPQPRVVQRPPQPIAAPVEATPADNDSPNQPAVVGGAVAPSPSNPFGIPAGSSARPGVIAPVPQQPAPNQPRGNAP
jgi:hypothetical protein